MEVRDVKDTLSPVSNASKCFQIRSNQLHGEGEAAEASVPLTRGTQGTPGQAALAGSHQVKPLSAGTDVQWRCKEMEEISMHECGKASKDS